MSEANRIKRQLETAFQGPAWHGPPLMENVRGVSEEAARAKPVAGAHSIWEIVNHVAAWYDEAIAVVGGKPYVTLKGDADWPPIAGTWADAVAHLEASHAKLIEKLAGSLPKSTCVASPRPVPTIVTAVPPFAGPAEGLMLVFVGGGR